MTIRIKDNYFNYDNVLNIVFTHNKDLISSTGSRVITDPASNNTVINVFDKSGGRSTFVLDSETGHKAQEKLERAIINNYILVDLTEQE